MTTPPRDRLAEIERALKNIIELGTKTTMVRIGDMWSDDGFDEHTEVSEEASLASAALTTLAEMRADMVGLAELSARAMDGPLKLDEYNGTFIWGPSRKGGDNLVAEVRGWGYLTGGGTGALGLSEAEGIAIQKATGTLIARSVNIFRKWLGETA